MTASIFLSHSHADKPFARQLARDLKRHGVKVWLDEAELQIGDSLIEKLEEAIDTTDYLGVVLSPASVESKWVKREVMVALEEEIEGKRVKVLPLLVADCTLPAFLRTKLYADFRPAADYAGTLSRLLARLGVETQRKVSESDLFTTLSGSVARADCELIREAINGFLTTARGAYDGLARDVLGSIASWNERAARNEAVYETVARASLDAHSADEASALAAVRYLRWMAVYFKPHPPRAMAEAPRSPLLAERLGGALCIYAYGLYGTIDDALDTLPSPGATLPLRAASALVLGLSSYAPANGRLCAVAAQAAEEPPILQFAILEGLGELALRAAPGQTLPGVAALVLHAGDALVRRRAARQLLELTDAGRDENAIDRFRGAIEAARRLDTESASAELPTFTYGPILQQSVEQAAG